MSKPFSCDEFDAYLRSTGRCYNHMNTAEKNAAMKEFLARNNRND